MAAPTTPHADDLDALFAQLTGRTAAPAAQAAPRPASAAPHGLDALFEQLGR